MKGLRKVLTPFAPDQSGAVSVLFDLGGLTVILDAGGCTGNICGFDEPRWQTSRSAIFSAGLRDMDAILGSDDILIKKIERAVESVDAKFISLVGTPVPAVIGTDFGGLVKILERKTGIPAIAVECYGMKWYDKGASDCYLKLFKKFAKDDVVKDEPVCGVLGAIPLDYGLTDVSELEDKFKGEKFARAVLYGNGASLEDIKNAGSVAINYVASASGLEAAKYLKERFGTPYEFYNPYADKFFGLHALFVGDEAAGATARKNNPELTIASFFTIHDEVFSEGDVRLEEEDDFINLVHSGNFDTVVCDPVLNDLIPDFPGLLIPFPHFAVSGRL